MKNSFSQLFYVKKGKIDNKQKIIIYLRITVNGWRSELSIQRKVSLEKWSSGSGKVKGYSSEAQEINQHMDSITNKINKIHQRFVDEEKPFTSKSILDTYLGRNENKKMLLKIFQDHWTCAKMGIDTNKGLLLSGPVGCGKTSLMKLLPYLAPHKTNYEIIPTRNIVFNFNAAGFEVLEKYNDTKNYCFDDLGVEPTGCHYTKDCNVMGEILLWRYDLFKESMGVAERSRSKTHITTNLNAEELEARYGSQVRSRLREMFNLVGFDESSKDKRI